MSKVQAEAGSTAYFRSREMEEERAAYAGAVEIAQRFSPRVEAIASPLNACAEAHRLAVVLLIDSFGTGTLFGSAESYVRKLYEHTSPLQAMNPEERMVADYAGTSVTVGQHPMEHCRMQLHRMNVFPAGDLKLVRHGTKARIAGQVIARQRPGTAHGFIFLSIEDETGIANAIIDPDLYKANRSLVTYAKFLLIEGTFQNVDKVIHIRAKHIEELNVTAAPMDSHDFH